MPSYNPQKFPQLAPLKTAAALAALLPATMIFAFFLNSLLNGFLYNFGIVPRSPQGLLGIPLAPFLHANLPHLLKNLAPLVGLLFLLGLFFHLQALKLISIMILASNSLVWLFASYGNHLGASGLVFALFSFFVSNALLKKNIPLFLLATLVFLAYYSLLPGLLPLHPSSQIHQTSFASHWAGLLSGAAAARFSKTSK